MAKPTDIPLTCVLIARVPEHGKVEYCWEPLRDVRFDPNCYVVNHALELGTTGPNRVITHKS